MVRRRGTDAGYMASVLSFLIFHELPGIPVSVRLRKEPHALLSMRMKN
jgi:hypothetical protein